MNTPGRPSYGLVDSNTTANMRTVALANEPIKFHKPLSTYPTVRPNFDPGPDIILDPYGGLWCIVCKTNVPASKDNINQHVSGRKHENFNRRFANLREKEFFRKRVLDTVKQFKLAEGEQQQQQQQQIESQIQQNIEQITTQPKKLRQKVKQKSDRDKPLLDLIDLTEERKKQENLDLSDGEIDSEDDHPLEHTIEKATQNIISVDQKHNNIKMDTKKTINNINHHKQVDFDKQSFLADLIADSDDEMKLLDNSTDDDDDDDNNVHINAKKISIEERRIPFGPLNISTQGVDLFYDTMPEETKPSENAKKVKEMLSNATPTKKTMSSAKSDSDGIDIDEITADISHPGAAFISIDDDVEKQKVNRNINTRNEQYVQPTDNYMAIQLRDINSEVLPPWLLDLESTEDILYSSDSSEALHFEILEFERFVSPTKQETESRNEMIMVIESIVKKLWPNSTTQVFGSYATGLCLPASDVDICVLETPKRGDATEFQTLANAVRSVPGFAKRVTVIKAKVPLVKIVVRKSSMNCDISIGVENGPKNVPNIKRYIAEMPPLRPLLLVIKCFLQQRDLNEVFKGGLGSYTILLLVVSHLQMIRYNFPQSKANLGSLLYQFMQLYGRMLNTALVGIRCKDNGSYFDKYEVYNTQRPEILRYCIEDPNDVTNELGRNSFAMTRVRKAFQNASQMLNKWRRDNASCTPTPLSSIIQCDELFRRRRRSVIDDMKEKGMHPLEAMLPKPNRFIRRSNSFKNDRAMSSSGRNFAEYNHRGNDMPRYSSSDELRRNPRSPKRFRSSNSGAGSSHMITNGTAYMPQSEPSGYVYDDGRATTPGYHYANRNEAMYYDEPMYPRSMQSSYGSGRPIRQNGRHSYGSYNQRGPSPGGRRWKGRRSSHR